MHKVIGKAGHIQRLQSHHTYLPPDWAVISIAAKFMIPLYTSTVIRKTNTEVVTGSTGSFFPLKHYAESKSQKTKHIHTPAPECLSLHSCPHIQKISQYLPPLSLPEDLPAGGKMYFSSGKNARPAFPLPAAPDPDGIKAQPGQISHQPPGKHLPRRPRPLSGEKITDKPGQCPYENPVSGPSAMPLITTMAVPA